MSIDWWRLWTLLLAAVNFGWWWESVPAAGWMALVLVLWDTRKEGER